MVPRVFGGFVDGLWGGGAREVGAAVGEGDHLGEGVGSMWPAQQRGVSFLGLVDALRDFGELCSTER